MAIMRGVGTDISPWREEMSGRRWQEEEDRRKKRIHI